MIKTEFFETAVKLGYYGEEKGGLFGKKDNARKYWEDVAIKNLLKPLITDLLNNKEKIRITDFGCGSGEGYELITHILSANNISKRDFLLNPDQIEFYLGLDISESMINMGNSIYSRNKNMKFIKADLSRDYPFLNENSFDIYLSTYSSPSHLTELELKNLVEKVFSHASGKSYLILDLFGKYSPEWPCYWDKQDKEMLAYNMSWLHLPAILNPKDVEEYYVKFWDSESLIKMLNDVALKLNKKIEIATKDRSLFIGRHIDTGYYNAHPQSLRYQVNRLFDMDYEGKLEELKPDFSFLEPYKEKHPKIIGRINDYSNKWNTVIDFCIALMETNNNLVKELIETTNDELAEDLKMLAWLYRNSQRFPVDHFLANIMGPQIACVLRNLESNLPDGLGCGHGLFCIVEIN